MATNTKTRKNLLETYHNAGSELATIYLPSPSATEDAEQRLEIRRKNALSQLAETSASPALIQSATSALEQLSHDDGYAHVVIVNGSTTVLSQQLHRPVSRVAVHLGRVPALIPLLAATQSDGDHLAVLLDRAGADVLRRSGVADPIDSTEVDGSDSRLHRGHPGGWSQRRFQQIAENAWENNAREVVDQIRADHPEIDMIICGGDARAVGFFAKHLPARFEVHQVDGSRHADQDAFLDAADVVLRDRAAKDTVAVLDEWRSKSANGLGSTGREVLDLLTRGRVEQLLVVDDTWNQDRPTTSFDFELRAHVPHDSSATSAAVTDGAIALALATDAVVTVVPEHPDIEDGLAAIHRF